MSVIAGCGYLGNEVARLEKKPLCLTRNPQTVANLLKQGFDAELFDTENTNNLKKFSYLFENKHVYYFIPPPASGVMDNNIKRFLALLSPVPPKKILLVSTTGVYGDCQGKWINESQPLKPRADRAKRRLDAERQLAEFAEEQQIDYTILRVPGIYGPGKLPVERIQSGKPVLALKESPYSNRIHVSDLAHICFLAMHKKLSQKIYNVADNHPTSMSDYFIQVARALRLPEPPQVSMKTAKNLFSANMLSYLTESKRIDNRAILRELPYQLRYPDLQTGLKDISCT